MRFAAAAVPAILLLAGACYFFAKAKGDASASAADKRFEQEAPLPAGDPVADEYDRQLVRSLIERKIRRMRTLMADIDNVYFNIKSERHSFYQALLSLGDRRVAPVVEAAERNGGNWRAALAETGVDAHFFVFRDRSADAVLPWDIIDGGLKDNFFRSEFDKSLREESTLPPKRQKENARLLPVLQ